MQQTLDAFIDWFAGIRIPLGDWAEVGVDFISSVFAPIFAFIRAVLLGSYEAIYWVIGTPHAIFIIVALTLLAFVVRGWKLALGSFIGFLLIHFLGIWDPAMQTLSLVIVASLLATVIAIPLGIWAAKVDTVSRLIRPILDFMQTMPAFVYLIPALLLFSVGVVPGIFATVIFAMAPGVRLTELGIRGVDQETVEAGQAFGSPPGRILRQIQLPLALPSIMAGLNQLIMLSLSMVVIAGMVGASGLGTLVIAALQRIDLALGFEAGFAVVIIAIYLDRITSSFGSGTSK